ncbi:MAG: hypothetical protein AAF371_06385 [Pseudomonadota bacterium]
MTFRGGLRPGHGTIAQDGRDGKRHPASTPSRPARLPDWLAGAPSVAENAAAPGRSALAGGKAAAISGGARIADRQRTADRVRHPDAMGTDTVDAEALERTDAAAPQDHAATASDLPRSSDPTGDAPHEPAEESSGGEAVLEGIAAELHDIGQRLESMRESAERHAAACFGAAAESCLPNLAQSGFAEEVTAACHAVSREMRAETVEVALPPCALRPVADALEARAPEIAFRLIADPSLPAGSARIAWPDGGATIVADRLAHAALEVLRRRLGPGALAPPSLSTRGERA